MTITAAELLRGIAGDIKRYGLYRNPYGSPRDNYLGGVCVYVNPTIAEAEDNGDISAPVWRDFRRAWRDLGYGEAITYLEQNDAETVIRDLLAHAAKLEGEAG